MTRKNLYYAYLFSQTRPKMNNLGVLISQSRSNFVNSRKLLPMKMSKCENVHVIYYLHHLIYPASLMRSREITMILFGRCVKDTNKKK